MTPPARHITLGVHIGHDAAAAIFTDTELRFAEEEERHTRQKAHNGCPWNAIDAALRAVSAADHEVRTVAITWNLSRYFECRRELAEHARRVGNPDWSDRRDREIRMVSEGVSALRERFGHAELVDFPHHLAHLACAVYFTPRKVLDSRNEPASAAVAPAAPTVLGVVVDALGDAESLTAFLAPDAGRLLSAPEIVLSRSPYQSIGFFYKRAAEAFGFAGREACGYLMALSGCADGREQAEWVRNRLFEPPDRFPSFDTDRFDPFRGSGEAAGRCFSQELLEPLGLVPADEDFLLRAKQANAIQTITEDYLEKILRGLISTHAPGTLYLSGGVSLNCVALGKLAEAFPEVDLVPCAVKKDSGTAIGAGVLAEVGRVGRQVLEHPRRGTRGNAGGGVRRSLRLGTSITGEEADWTHPPTGSPGSYEVFSSSTTLVSALADDVASGALVAVVDGAGEFGPRALGARSIIALASSRALSAHLNEHVKKRFSFQPFAGAFLEEEFFRLHPGKAADPFMSYALQLDGDSLEGILHQDGSSRIQLVPPSEDSILRLLLLERVARGAPGVVLNTSLNARGEPIARTPEDVMTTCAQLGVERIYTPIGRWTPCP